MPRQEMIQHWLCDFFSINDIALEVASEDASFRRYFRVHHAGKSYIVMDAPPEKEPLEPFASLADFFRGHGMNMPQIYAKDEVQGFLLLSDFGKVCYLDKLDAHSADALYEDAIDAMLVMQGLPCDLVSAYDDTLLCEEMSLFLEWYLERHLNVQLDAEQTGQMKTLFSLLASSALAQPQVMVHRDYHSRNLMVVDEHNLGIIDFQDAVQGAFTYDVVSLLKDCYITWPDAKVEQWLRYYYDRIKGQYPSEKDFDFEQLQRWFDFMGVQRHLKVVGVFSRLYYRDGKPGYMADIPRVLQYLQAMGRKYPELQILETVVLLQESIV